MSASVDVPEAAIDSQQHVSLREILRTKKFWSKVEKARFVSDYLDGTIQSVGRIASAIRSIYFDRADVEAYLKATHAERAKDALTFREAAVTLGCSSECVKGMLVVGLLKRKEGPYWRSVCKTSVDEFANERLPLSALTTPLKTTVRKLRRVAEESGFTLLLVTNRSSVVTPFIERTLALRLRQQFLGLQDLAARRKAAKLESKTEADRLQEYFTGLRDSGTQLPRRAKSPNKRAIALSSGISRNSFYSDAAVADLLVAYDKEDRDRYQIENRDDISMLKDFLESAQLNGVAIPARPCGRPHKSHIAKEAGVDRSVFYRSPTANQLVRNYGCGDDA